MADNTKTISIQFKVDQASLQQMTRAIQQFGNETKKMFDDINKSSGGLFSAGDRVKGIGSGGNANPGGQTQKQQLNVGVGDAMIKSMDQLRAAMRGFSSDIKSALSTANSSVRDSVRSQTRDLDELERKYDKVAQKARSMGGGRSGGGGGGDDLGSLVARYGGGYEPKGPTFGRGFYTRMAQLDEGYYGQTSGAVNQQFSSPAMEAKQGTIDNRTNYRALAAGTLAVGLAANAEYYNRPFEDVEHRAIRGEFYGSKVQGARMVSADTIKEIAAMNRLKEKEKWGLNQLNNKGWQASADVNKMFGSVGGGVLSFMGAASTGVSAVQNFKFMDPMLAMEAQRRLVDSEVKSEPVINAALDRAMNGNADRVRAMRSVGVGQKYNPKTGTWTDNLGLYEAKLSESGYNLGDAAGGFASIERTGGYATGSRYKDLAMRMSGGHMSSGGSYIGAAAQMGMKNPGMSARRMIGAFKDPLASDTLGGFLSQSALSGGTMFNMDTYLGGITANQGAFGKMGAGQEMFLAQGTAQAAQNQSTQLFGGKRDALQTGLNLQSAFDVGAKGIGAYMLANNPNVGKWAAQVAAAKKAGKDPESAMPAELKAWGVTADMLLNHVGNQVESELRSVDRLAANLNPDSAVGKAQAAADKAGLSMTEYLKTIDPKEANKINAQRQMGEYAIENDYSMTAQKALGYSNMNVLNPRVVKPGSPKDASSGSRDRKVTGTRGATAAQDVKTADKIVDKNMLTKQLETYKANSEDSQRMFNLNTEQVYKNIMTTAEAIETLGVKVQALNKIFDPKIVGRVVAPK